MSTCTRCGATFHCGMADAADAANSQPCWCAALPAVLPVPDAAALSEDQPRPGCWCPACLQRFIETRRSL
ncbi:cysteine-rich CWC family protein [Oxalobacteraceae bacterium A2-2]